MASSVTLKITLQDDLRRISVPATISFDTLTAQIVKLFGLPSTNELLLKYVDDEGDQVSVTSSEELQEAFRVSGNFRPPILRIFVSVVSNNAVPRPATPVAAIPSQPIPVPVARVATPPPVEDLREYPALDVSEWDAPAKEPQPAVFVTIINPAPSAKSELSSSARYAIGQQTRRDCVQTSGQVNKLAEEVRAETIKLSNMQRDETTRLSREQVNESLRHSQDVKTLVQQHDVNMDLCSELSRQIMEECKRLSCETARLSSQLAHAQREFEPSIAREVSDLCAKTSAMCRELCQSTTLLTQ